MKLKILPIAGDASFRSFYRIKSKKNSKIAVVAKKEKYKNLIAYSAINRFLKKNKIFSPKLYHYDLKSGIIIIEDFGNLTFDKVLLKKKNKLNTYKKLVDLLLKIQKIKPQTKIKNIISKKHVIKIYSKKYLQEESDLFFNWYLPLLFKKNKVNDIKRKIKKILKKLYKRLYFKNSCFVHRDYHSQNLMKVNEKIGVIDSQDALIGHPAYDLVSLVDDVRIKTSQKLKKQIYDYYLTNADEKYRLRSDKFLEDFNVLSVQRSLKIIGIFSRLFKRDNKSKYMKFIPYTWKLLEMRMNSRIFLNLKKILEKNISQKQRKKILK